MKNIILLRGININGKNKISMDILKSELESIGFKNVYTYLNSGNIILESTFDKDKIKKIIENLIIEKFNLDIPVFVITYLELKELLENKPNWWGLDNKEIYDNIIFLIPPTKYDEVYGVLGSIDDNIEKIKKI